MRGRGGERILGPYEQPNGFRVIAVDAAGNRTYKLFDTEAKAQRYADLLAAELSSNEHTTASALVEYKTYLTTKGNRQASIDVTEWAIEQFFPEPLLLSMLSSKRCADLYDATRTRPSEHTGKPLAADTHRNILAQVKSFLAWCVKRRWLRANPAAEVEGVGKRRPRGKSLGKSGKTLRVKEARGWYIKAVELAEDGDDGATAALVALLLGMRASEITSRRVSDLDEDEAPGDLLWIPCSKTPAGRRTLEVPHVLRPLLVRCCEGKGPDRYIFECGRKHERGKKKPHLRDWVIAQVHRVCDAAKVPRVTAHAMRGLLATITAERGLAGHLIAATLGHEDERTTLTAYAAPGAAAAGANRRGLVLLEGGLKAPPKDS
jgi:integrase